ncbi:hypothetical protein XELAEV_18006002mg, partial [Xenopus laevis]
MKSTYGGGTVKPLKDWHKWSSGLEWSIPKEGTFEVWIWEKFVREFHSRLQTHGSLEKANLWLQESTKLQQQGIQKSQTVRSNIIMYSRPARTAESNNDKDETELQTGLNLLATQVISTASAHLSPSPSPHPEPAKDASDKTDYCRLGKSDLVTLCEARGKIREILNDLLDHRMNPRGFAKKMGVNQLSYGMSGADCALILRAAVGEDVADDIISRCAITKHEQLTMGGKEFCKQLTDKMPTMYSVVSPFQFMTAIQGRDEDASVYWRRLKQGVTDAGFEPGPDALENTQPVSPIHLMLKATFLAGLVPKLRDRLMVARPEAHSMSFHSLMATIQAIDLDLHASKEAKSAKIMAALELIVQDHHPYTRKKKLTKRTNITCFNCDQKGHLARHCPENEDKKEQNSPSPYKVVPDQPHATQTRGNLTV